MRAVIFVLLLSSVALSHGLGGMATHKCVHDVKFKDNEVMEMPTLTAHEKARLLQSLTGGTNPNYWNGAYANYWGNSPPATPAAPAAPVAPPKPTVQTVNDGWHQFRIGVDLSYADKLVLSNPALKTKYELSVRLIESVRNYFSRYFEVNYFPTMDFKGGSCQGNKIEAFSKPVDLFITVAPENDPSTDYFAAAAPCYISPRDGRPTVGAYILNLAFLETSYLNEFLYFSTFAHEFTHILGFTDSLYPKFVKPGTTIKRTDVTAEFTISGEKYTAITMPEVVNFARGFFGCSQLPGVPLENNGGSGSAGSHWEKLFLPQEYMNPTVENPGIISDFTLTFLKATGWYQVDANAAQRYDWGEKAGCGHFSVCPQNSTGYCTEAQVSQSICSSEWMSKAVCTQDRTFSSGCFVKRSREHSCLLKDTFKQGDTEYYGPDSRCLNYVSNGGYAAQCHKVACTNTGIDIIVGSKKVTCAANEGGKTKEVGLNFQLQCPDYNNFCSEFAAKCVDDCNGAGICTKAKVCYCYTGFTGNSCGTKSTSLDYTKINKIASNGGAKSEAGLSSNIVSVAMAMIAIGVSHLLAF